MGDVVNLLERPTYGFVQVDHILGLETGTSQRWIDGYDRGGKHYDPIVRHSSAGDPIATWGEFVEARLLSEYRGLGVSIFRMRPAVERLREEFGPYPLASAGMWLGEAGRDLVRRTQDEVSLDRSQWIVVPRTGATFLPGLEGTVRWSDRAQRFADSLIWSDDYKPVLIGLRPMSGNMAVLIDPLRGFGDPVVRNVPTEIIAELFRAGDPPEMIAELYELSVTEVNEAVRYEMSRQAA